eukprot:7215911-Prymnesium_polylepis.1
MYTKAAEWYLQALRKEKESADKEELARLRRTMGSLLDRAEQLKSPSPAPAGPPKPPAPPAAVAPPA